MKVSEIEDHVQELSVLAMMAMNGIVSNRAIIAGFPTKIESHKIAKTSYEIANYMLMEKKAVEEKLVDSAEDE
jgi:hypothetical protein